LEVLGIIPARYGSARFPGKPLVEIDGKTMIQRVYEQASFATSLDELTVATDDKRIFDHVQSFSGNVMMTNPDHQNGTERCFEVVDRQAYNFKTIINIQGDEPFIQPEQIDLLAACLESETVQIATLVKKIDDFREFISNTIVKVIVNKNSQALYFSRTPIPYINNPDKELLFRENAFYKHIGIYGYKSNTLKELVNLPASKLEELESLEQLRWLENGYKIFVKETELESVSIDTPEDLDQLEK